MTPRVLIYAPYSAPGDPALCDALVAAQIPCAYLCTGPTLIEGLPPQVAVSHLPLDEPTARGSIVGRMTSARERTKRDLKKVQAVAQAIASQRPTHIIAGDIELGVPTALLARDAEAPKIKVIGLSHGSDVYTVPQRSPLQQAQIVESLVSCNAILGFTRAHIRDIEELSDDALDHREMHALGAWIDLEHFAPPPTDPRQPQPLVLCLRGEREVYRSIIIKNAAGMVDRELPLTLRINLNADWRRDLLWHTRLESGRVAAVFERIPRARMPAEYARADLVVHALAKESLGYSSLEAMACGRALVQIDTPLARELCPPEQHAFLVPEGPNEGATTAAFAAQMARLLKDHDTRRELEIVNRAWAEAHFDRRRQLPQAAAALAEWLVNV